MKKTFTILHTNDMHSALRSLPAASSDALPTIPHDERALEVRAIRVG
jgi:2',3'-cyclic-nucleotide 2'-phosphodiesterase (5'-nucleotidase family)